MNPSPDQIRSRQTAYVATEAWWKTRVEQLAAQFRQRAEWELSIEDGIETEASAVRRATWACAALALETLLAQRLR